MLQTEFSFSSSAAIAALVLFPFVVLVIGCAWCKRLFRKNGGNDKDEERSPLLGGNKRDQPPRTERIENEEQRHQTRTHVERTSPITANTVDVSYTVHAEPARTIEQEPIQQKLTTSNMAAEASLIPDLLMTDEQNPASENFEKIHQQYRPNEPDILETQRIIPPAKFPVTEPVQQDRNAVHESSPAVEEKGDTEEMKNSQDCSPKIEKLLDAPLLDGKHMEQDVSLTVGNSNEQTNENKEVEKEEEVRQFKNEKTVERFLEENLKSSKPPLTKEPAIEQLPDETIMAEGDPSLAKESSNQPSTLPNEPTTVEQLPEEVTMAEYPPIPREPEIEMRSEQRKELIDTSSTNENAAEVVVDAEKPTLNSSSTSSFSNTTPTETVAEQKEEIQLMTDNEQANEAKENTQNDSTSEVTNAVEMLGGKEEINTSSSGAEALAEKHNMEKNTEQNTEQSVEVQNGLSDQLSEENSSSRDAIEAERTTITDQIVNHSGEFDEVEEEKKDPGKITENSNSLTKQTAFVDQKQRDTDQELLIRTMTADEEATLEIEPEIYAGAKLKKQGTVLLVDYDPKEADYKTKEKMEKLEEHLSEVDFGVKPTFVKSIRTKAAKKDTKPIFGLTVLDDELFVISQNNPDIEVYDSNSLDFKHQFHIEGLYNPVDIKSCRKNKHLYIFDYRGEENEIYKVDSNGKLILNWPTKQDGGFMSIAPDGNILLSVWDRNVLLEYSPDGQQLCEIKLPSFVVQLRLGIKLSNGNILLSQGEDDGSEHRVYILDERGTEVKFVIGGAKGFSKEQFDSPNYLSVDRTGHVLVADQNNKRVVLLSPQLEFRDEVIQEADGLRYPVRLEVNEVSGRLFVADNDYLLNERVWKDGRIIAFDFKLR